MTMQKRYERAVLRRAMQLADSWAEGWAVMPCESYLIDDISSRYEKTCINRLERSTRRYIKDAKRYATGADLSIQYATLYVLNTRRRVLEEHFDYSA